MVERCAWAENNELDTIYHDQEWGVPLREDDKLFEYLILESLQAGLSWATILKKRDSLTQAHDHWDYRKIAQYDEAKVAELLADPGVIRHKLKIRATISNAAAFMRIQEEFGSFSDYLWAFVDGQPQVNGWQTLAEVPASTELSDVISRDLKKRGFKFLGSTTVYAFLQATGVVNDHLQSCFRFQEVASK